MSQEFVGNENSGIPFRRRLTDRPAVGEQVFGVMQQIVKVHQRGVAFVSRVNVLERVELRDKPLERQLPQGSAKLP